ncbi:MAG: ferritin [Nitrospiraceae bacterium]|nr:ferritin [Nitrospiraceae bacterium]
MLSEKMEKALNGQINAEFYSAYLYLSMAAYFDASNLKGFASWMRVQNQEETMHAMKLFDYVSGKGATVTLQPIEGPQTEWESPLAVFEATLEHERKVTGLINALVDTALDERDHATNIMLQWFVTEQVEEEASVDDVVQQLKLMANAPGGLFMLDRELGQRAFNAPTAE